MTPSSSYTKPNEIDPMYANAVNSPIAAGGRTRRGHFRAGVLRLASPNSAPGLGRSKLPYPLAASGMGLALTTTLCDEPNMYGSGMLLWLYLRHGASDHLKFLLSNITTATERRIPM